MIGRVFCLMAALALGAGMAAADAGSSRAAAPVPTVMTLAPVPVTYPALQATVSGTLLTQATSSSPARPVPDEQITILDGIGCLGPAQVVGTATTGPDGSFHATLTVPGAGTFWARFAGDASYAANGTSKNSAPIDMPTQITLDPLPPVVTAHSTLHVTGTVQVQTADGTWLPAPCAWVSVNGPKGNEVSTATGPDGTFAGSFAVTGSGPFRASTYAWTYGFEEDAASARQAPEVITAASRVAGFKPATPLIAQNGLTFAGQAQVAAPGSTAWSDSALPAQLWFRPAGTAAWTLWGTTYFPNLAVFPGYLPNGKPAEGSWQYRIAAAPQLLPSATAVLTIPVKVRTWINSTRLTTSRQHRFLSGTLNDHPASGPVADQAIRLYYRTPGSSTWHYLATTRTRANGTFTFTLGTHRRWYRASYPGHGYYLPAISPAIYNP